MIWHREGFTCDLGPTHRLQCRGTLRCTCCGRPRGLAHDCPIPERARFRHTPLTADQRPHPSPAGIMIPTPPGKVAPCTDNYPPEPPLTRANAGQITETATPFR
jgi:hypothetical protein